MKTINGNIKLNRLLYRHLKIKSQKRESMEIDNVTKERERGWGKVRMQA